MSFEETYEVFMANANFFWEIQADGAVVTDR